MARGEPASGGPSRRPGRLQHGEPDFEPARQHLIDEAEAGLSAGERDQLRAVKENLERRDADLELYNRLALREFTGPEYEMLASELASYGFSVVCSWLRRGVIFKYCADRGRVLHPADSDRERLERPEGRDEREELASETVARALRFFRERALLGRKWSHEGGATLKTYFVGACIFAFPAIYRRWAREWRRWRRVIDDRDLSPDHRDSRTSVELFGTDTAHTAISNITVAEELTRMPPRMRTAATMLLDGHSQAEIADHLDTTERAVEGMLHRYRKNRRRPPQRDGRDMR